MIRRAFSLATLLVFAVFVVPQYSLQAGAPIRPGEVTFGVGVSDEEVSASFDTLFPLAVPKNGLLFLNPKVTAGDELDPRVSIGLGYRHLFEGSKVIVGANLFYDCFDTIHNNRINQLGIGAEVLTRWVDFRANYYLPEQERHVIDKAETVSISRSASTSSQALGPRVTGQNLGFQGNNIIQTTNGLNETATTTRLRQVETETAWERYESGMRGGDAEIGVLIPGLERYAEVRVFGGYYFFNNEFGADINGFKGRLEVRAVPAVTFDAMYYDDKEVIGSNWFYGVRVSAPFDLANLANGKSPFAGFADSFKRKDAVSEQEMFARRMTENVIRTSRVSTSESKFIKVGEYKEVYEGSQTVVTSTPFSDVIVLTLAGAPINVAHVNNGAGGTGTFETPFNSLTAANADPAKAARNIVYVHSGTTFAGQTFTLAANQRLLGEGGGNTHLFTSDQGTFTLPPVNGTALARPTGIANVTLPATGTSEVSNLDITGLAGPGITATTAGVANINRVAITGGADGIFVGPSTGTVNITGSTITNPAGNGINIVGGSATVNFGSAVTDPANAIFGASTITQNAGGAAAVNVGAGHTGAFTLATGSTITSTTGTGLGFDDADGTYTFNGATTLNGNGLGLNILNDSDGTFAFNGLMQIANTTGRAVNFDGSPTGTVTFLNLDINQAVGEGVLATGSGLLTITGGSIDNVAGDGINSTNTALNITGVSIGTAAAVTGDGIEVINNDATARTVTLANNTLGNPATPLAIGGRGIFVNGAGTGLLTATVSGNNIFSAGNALDLSGGATLGSLVAAIDGNTVQSTTAGTFGIRAVGVNLNTTQNSAVITSLNGNTVTPNGVGGGMLFQNITFDADGVAGGAVVQVNGGATNIGANFGAPAAADRVQGQGLAFINPTGDINFTTLNIANNAGDGLFVQGASAAPNNVFALSGGGSGTINTTGGAALNLDPLFVNLTFGNVTSTNSPTSGVILDGLATGSMVNITNTTVTGSTGDGIFVRNAAGATLNFGTTNVTNAGADGIDLTNAGAATVTFGMTTITGFGAGNAGVNFTGSDATAAFGVTNIQNSGANLGMGTGIDLTSSQNNRTITFATGSNISNVAIGVRLSNGAGTSANSNFTFGDGNAANGLGSTINAPTTVSAADLNSASGTYNFLDVNFTGTPIFPAPVGGALYFVNATGSGAGDGSSIANAATISTANTHSGANLATTTTYVLVNNAGTISLGATTFGLGANDRLDGFGNGNTFSSGAPANVLGFGAAITDANGAATLTGTGPLVTLANANVAQNLIFSGGTTSFSGTGINDFTFNNATLSGGSTAAFSFISPTGTISINNSTIMASGLLLNVNGGSATVQVAQGTGTALSGSGVAIANTTGGSATITGAALTPGAGGTAVLLTSNAGTVNFVGGSISNTAGAFGLDVNGGTAAVTYGGSITSSSGNSVRVQNRTGGTLDVTGALNDTGAGVLVQNNTGGAINFSNASKVLNTGANQAVTLTNNTGATINFTGGGLDIDTTSALGFGATGGIVNVSGTGNSITTTAGKAIDVSGITSGMTFGSIASTGSGTQGLNLALAGGTFAVTGTTSVTNSTGDAIKLTGSGVTFTFDTTNITNAGADGIDLTALTGNSTANFGATTITDFGNANGGVNFAGADVTSAFGITSIQGGGAGTGIDLSSTLNNRTITFAKTSSITNVATGVQLSSSGTTATTANANFTFGDGEGVTDKASTISATTTVAAIGLNAASGTYNFLDVVFTGAAAFPAAPGALFVSDRITLGGDGSVANPYHVSEADAILTGGVTFAFLDGAYNFLTLNAGSAFTIGATQSVDGLDNSNAIAFGTVQPANVSGDFGAIGGSVTRANTGNGTLSITNGAAASVFTLLGSNMVENITLTGEAGAIDPTTLFASNGGAVGFNNAGGITIGGVTLGNLQAASTALDFVAMLGAVSIQNNNINVPAGRLLNVNGGSSTFTLDEGTGALAGGSIVIQSTTGGSITITGADLGPAAGVTGVALTSNAATVSFVGGSITNTAGTRALDISGGAAAVNFGGSITNSSGNSVAVSGRTGGAVDVSGALNDTGAGVLVQNNTGGAITFSNASKVLNTGANQAVTLTNNTGATINFTGGGLDIDTTSGLGFGANSGTVNVSGAGNSITTTAGKAIDVSGITSGMTFGSIASTGSGTQGLNLALAGGTFTVTGTTSVTNSTGDAIKLTGSGVTFNFGTTNITNAGADGIDLSALTGNSTANFGATTITDFGNANVGVNFAGADVSSAFGITSIQGGGAGTGIDLSSTLNNRTITFAKTSSITNVAVGVRLTGGSAATAANANFTFGDGENAVDVASTITAPITVSALGLPAAQGTYNFLDVTLTGNAEFDAAPGSATFVSTRTDANGSGTFADPYRVSFADAITTTGINFAFLDGAYDFATLNANAAFSLSDGQTLAGLDNANAFSFGLLQPSNVTGNFGAIGGTVDRASTGNGTLSITNTAAAGVFSLLGGGTVEDITLNGAAATTTLFAASGAGNVTIQGVTITNMLNAAGTAFDITKTTGTVSIQNNNITAPNGRLLNVDGGAAAITFAAATGAGSGPGTVRNNDGSGIRVRNTTGGSVTLTNLQVTSANATPLTFDNNDATFTITGSTFAADAGVTFLDVDATSASTTSLVFNNTNTLTHTAGRIAVIGAGARNIDLSAHNFTNTGTTAANVISSTGQTGGTISFGNVNITGFDNAGGTAVSLAGVAAGTVSFADLDVATTNGSGLNVGGITFAPGATPTINATNGSALILNGTTLNGGAATLSSVSSATSAATGVSLTNVIGNLTMSAGAISGAAGGAFTVNGGSGNITYNGTITQNSAATAVSITNRTGGAAAFGGLVTANTSTATAINLTTNTGSTISFNGGLNIDTTTGAGFIGTGGGTINVAATAGDESITSTGARALLLNGVTAGINLDSVSSTGSATTGITLISVGGTANIGATTISGSADQAIFVTTSSADVNFGNTTIGTGAANSGGGAGDQGVRLEANTTGTRSFGDLTIQNSGGIGFLHTGDGGLTSITGTTNITGAATNGILIQSAAAGQGVTFGNTTVNTSGGTGVVLGQAGTGNAGAVTFAALNIAPNAGQTALTSADSTGTITTTSGTITATGAGSAIVINGGAGVTPLNLVFTAVNSAGGTNGISLTNTSGTANFGTGTLTGASGATFNVVGGTVSTTYSGNITQGNNAALVSISGGHATGTLLFQTGTLSASLGTGLQFDNADGTYNFTGTTTLNGGDAGIDILNGSGGTFSFGTGTAITNPTGTGFNFNGSTAGVTYSGNITQATASQLLVSITNQASGTITFQTGTLSASNGTGINLNNADGTVNFNGTTTLNGGNAHIDINTGSGGAITFASTSSVGATTAPTGVAFREDTSTANVTYNGTLRQTNAVNAVSINAKTGGTTTFGGAITATTTTANAINLTGNTLGAINFTGGGLAITTTTGIGFNATGGGTITVTGSNNTISSGAAPAALNVANTTIGANGMTFLGISANGGTSGIVLNTTGSGGLTVTGTGTTDGSGGTIQNTTNRGASFISASNISLSNMNFTNAGTTDLDADNSGLSTGDNLLTNAAIHLQTVTTVTLDNINISGGAEQGINGNTVANFQLLNSTITNVGNAADEDNIHFFNMSGTSAIVNTTLTHTSGGGDDNLNLQTTAGNLDLTISGGSAVGVAGGVNQLGSGYLFGIRGTTVANITFNSASSTDNFSGGIVADAFDSATMNLRVMNTTSTGNNDQLSVSAGDSSLVDLEATGSAFTSTSTTPGSADFVLVSLLGSAFDTGYVFDARIHSNTLTTANGVTADGISVFNAGGGVMNVAITNNTFDYAGTQRVILVQAGQDGSGITRPTITGNTVDIKLDGTGNAVAGFLVQTAITGPGNTSSMNANIGGAGALANVFTHSLGGSMAAGDIRVRQRNDGTFNLDGFGGPQNTAGTTEPNVIAYLAGRNTVVSPSTATFDSSGFSGAASPAFITVAVSVASVLEDGGTNLVYTLTRNGSTAAALNGVNFAITGTASPASDFTVIGAASFAAGTGLGTVNFAAGSATAVITIDPTGDADATEFDELVALDVGNSATANGSFARGVITDDAPLLFAPSATPSASSSNAALTQTSLNTLGNAAISLWAATGLTAQQTALLQTVTFGLADLAPDRLGEASGTQVFLSSTAAGNYWFIDATPLDHSEFTGSGMAGAARPTMLATPTGEAAGRVDALTVLLHEIGHVLGYDDHYGTGLGGPLMEGTLHLGERLLPLGGLCPPRMALGWWRRAGCARHGWPLGWRAQPALRSLFAERCTTISACPNTAARGCQAPRISSPW